MNREGREITELSRRQEVADRAGAIVTDHVRSVIDSAQGRAADLERDTVKQSNDLRDRACQVADEALGEVDAAGERLRVLVRALREDVDSVFDGRSIPETAD